MHRPNRSTPSRNAVAIPSFRQLPSSSSRPIRAAPRRLLRRATASRPVRLHGPESGLAFGAFSFWLRRLLPLPPQPEVTVGRSQHARSRSARGNEQARHSLSSASVYPSRASGRGGTGRRDGFRSRWAKCLWRFESSRPHSRFLGRRIVRPGATGRPIRLTPLSALRSTGLCESTLSPSAKHAQRRPEEASTRISSNPPGSTT